LGFRLAGGRRQREGEDWASVPGLPEASFGVWCLVGSRQFFQLEMFEFLRPRPRPLPVDHGPQDFGYSSFGIHVQDLDRVLDRIARTGGSPLTEPVGKVGSRRVFLRDPDGVLLELMEDFAVESQTSSYDSKLGPSVEFLSITVRSLERVREFWVHLLGFEEMSGARIHDHSHGRLLGVKPAVKETLVLRAGPVVLEFVQYAQDVCRPRPAGYLISDIGLLNLALGTLDRKVFEMTYELLSKNGFGGHQKPWCVPGVASVVYVQDPQGLSVELLHVEPAALARMGFIGDLSSVAP